MSEYWGYHMIINCVKCDKDAITTRKTLHDFIVELVQEIKMVAYGQPIIEHFATHDPDKGGYSIVQLIETSSITCHFIDKNGDGYVDVFSCVEFDENVVMDTLNKYFAPQAAEFIMINRQAGKDMAIDSKYYNG